MDDRGHMGKLQVAIVGAGFSGLSVAYYLRKYTNLQSFVIYERSEPTGGGAGTWKDNTYPGCACDVPIHLYQLSWARRCGWTEYLPLQPEIQEYLDETAKSQGFLRHIQFGTELVEARWIERENKWAATLRNVCAEEPETAVYTVKHDVLIMCTGPLSQPKLPENMNIEAFEGQQFHSQQWRHDISLGTVFLSNESPYNPRLANQLLTENKRVAVVGNGCSATQFLPIIARKTKSLTQYISSPQWYVPRDNPLYTDLQKKAFQYVPGAEHLYRLYLAYNWESEAYKLEAGDGAAKARAVVEAYFLAHMKATAPAKYHEALTPKFPLGCKRLVFDSNYFASLHANNVDLDFTRVKALHKNGIIGADGIEKQYDVIIWATGFTATMPFQSTKIYSRLGKEIHSLWQGQGAPSAYKGMAFPGFPNLYMTTGPNSLSGHYSVTTIIEIQAQWIAQVLKEQLDHEVKSFEITQQAHDEYNKWIAQRMTGRVWTSPNCSSWFKTREGLIPTNFPGNTVTYWKKTYFPDFTHFHQIGGRKQVYGTSIQRELFNITWKTAATLTFLVILFRNKHKFQPYMSVVIQRLISIMGRTSDKSKAFLSQLAQLKF